MIRSKEDYRRYLEADKRALGITYSRPPLILGDIWKYERLLRYCEYWCNCKYNPGNPFSRFYRKALLVYFERRGIRLHFSIPLNVCDEGLALAHVGDVIINDKAHIGRYTRIHAGVNIGTRAGERGAAPTLGDYCYIGPGAKLFGPVKVGSGVAIGANAVVTHDFPDDVTVAGVPAKIIADTGTMDREHPLSNAPEEERAAYLARQAGKKRSAAC